MLMIVFHKSTPQTLDKKHIILTKNSLEYHLKLNILKLFFEVKHVLTTLMMYFNLELCN